MTNIYQIWS